MNITTLMDGSSLWLISFALVLGILFSIEVGFRLGKRQRRRSSNGEKIETGAVVAASLGLLAFMLAFTFGAVASNFTERKQLLIDDVNSIGTLYLRADLLPDPERAEVKDIISNYVTLRIEVLKGHDGFQKVKQALAQFEEMQAELWAIAVAVNEQNPTPANALILQSINEVIDLHQKRIAVAMYQRMPSIFWGTLFGLTMLAMMVSGYNSGVSGGRRSHTATLGVTLAFSAVLLLIIALERPGLIIVSQDLMVELQKGINNPLKSQH
jgi:hypothetical protein